MIIHLIAGLIKICWMKFCQIQLYYIKMSQYFPSLYEPFGGVVNVKVGFSTYETKSDLKNATGTDTSKLSAKSDLVILKAEVDKKSW